MLENIEISKYACFFYQSHCESKHALHHVTMLENIKTLKYQNIRVFFMCMNN